MTVLGKTQPGNGHDTKRLRNPAKKRQLLETCSELVCHVDKCNNSLGKQIRDPAGGQIAHAR
jgi:hypothetical protein